MGEKGGEKGEGSGGKRGGNWEWGTPCPPPHLAMFISYSVCRNLCCENL